MLRKYAAVLGFLTLAASVWGQGLNVPPGVSKDDWEEINFEFNSSVLVDGFPSLLRLAELLQMNPTYRVRIVGHTDVIGGTQYNDRLGLARANAVRDFLVKYGAAPGQIEATSEGKANPRYPGQKDVYEKTDEARWMNRRVSLAVYDAGGKQIAPPGGAGAAIAAIPPAAAATNPDCCNEVLKRLDKLDDIAKMLKDLGDQNASLKQQLDALRNQQQVLESKVNQPPPAPPIPPSATEIGKEVTNQIAATKEPRFSLLSVNVGADDTGNLTVQAHGQYFAPFGGHYGFQANAEYLYFKNDREGQFDAGIVDRVGKHFQAGLFGSMKYADLAQYFGGGTLGQGAITLDYVFSDGTIGLFGTKGFKNQALMSTVAATDPVTGALLNHLFLQNYLSIVDQAGISTTLGLWGNNYIEANAGYLHGLVVGNRFGGTARLIFPLNNRLAVTVEGDINETLVGPKNSGAAMVGMEFSNRIRPKEMFAADHAVPVQVPRVRYEVIQKKYRNGDDPPVANAGPNQINVAAGKITLNGSASYSPDGNPITYQWTQLVGPQGTLSSPNTAITTFTAVAGESYQFELTVKDNYGLMSSAFVTVTTKATPTPTISFFTATPAQIVAGKSSTLSWSVTNATSVTISGVSGTLPNTGSVAVSPTATTTYTLTANNAVGPTTATVTVVVGAATPGFQSCYASPVNIIAGESATLNWVTTNAQSVSVGGVSQSFGPTGSYAVSPTATTTYTLTANGAGGGTQTCSIAITVTPGQVPRIILFSAIPATINAGQSTTLQWSVENSSNVTSTVSINNGVGTVGNTGSINVSPTTTTSYTLTASNTNGQATAVQTVTVNVAALPVITSFTASPTTSPGAGQRVNLTCNTTNATSTNIGGALFYGQTSTLPVFPTATTTYTCVATNQIGQTVSSSVTVTVPPAATGAGAPPTLTLPSTFIQTYTRTVSLSVSATSPSGNTPLTYSWTVAAGNIGLGAIAGATTANPTVTVGPEFGFYDVEVTVTDSKGNSASGVVRIQYMPNYAPSPAAGGTGTSPTTSGR